MRANYAPDGLAFYRAGEAGLLLEQRAAPDSRPYIHPLIAPDGVGVLTENAPSHHPWQHGLYVGLNDINGVGFWTERLHRHPEHDGSFHPFSLDPPHVEATSVRWAVRSVWKSPRGEPMLTEEQRWHLAGDGATYALDLDWHLTAAIDLTFGQYAYGGLFLRMPYRREQGGTVENSEGRHGAGETESQRARWVAVNMPIEGRPAASLEAGVAIMDHPANPEHPVPWRVDNQFGICPSRSIAGAWHLARGETSISQYRLLVFCGPVDSQLIERSWRAYAAAEATIPGVQTAAPPAPTRT